ncbi:unnamed protein product [Schistosoma intercalatum]|nr:unnamed protein product [Schistosoma intercalatum]
MPQDSKYLLIRYSSVVLRNLKILDYDFDTHNVPEQADSFSSFFKISRKAEFIHILHFLFRTLNPVKYDTELRAFLGPKSDVGFKNATYRWLRILSAEFPKVISNFFATWGCPAGIGVVRLLANLSSYVLVISNGMLSFNKQIMENDPNCEWVSFNSIGIVQRNLKHSLSHIISEDLLQRELQKGSEALDVEVQHASEEILKFKQLIVSDSDLRNNMNDTQLFSLCSDKTIGLPDELIAYQLELTKKVSTLKQQIKTYLDRHKPSLLQFNNILDSLNDHKPFTLNGSKMRFLQSGNILSSYLNDDTKEEPKQIDGKLNFHSFLRHSMMLLQMAFKSYNPCFTNDKFQELSSSQYSSSDCLTVFKQAIGQFYSQTSIDSSFSTHSEKELCQLMKEMRSTIDKLQLELKDEWLRESQLNIKFPELSATYSTISQPCISCETGDEYDVNNKSNNTFDISAESTLNKTDEALPIHESSHQLFKKSPARSNLQFNFPDESTYKHSTSSLKCSPVNDPRMNFLGLKKGNYLKVDHTTSNSLSPPRTREIENTLQNLSINSPENVLTDEMCTEIMSSTTDMLKMKGLDYCEDILKTQFPVTSLVPHKPPSIKYSLKDLSNIPVSIPPTFQSFSSTMELKESHLCNPTNSSFNLIDDDLEFVNDLLPSSPN